MSDWSSDVCSSDLHHPADGPPPRAGEERVLASPAVRQRAKDLGIDLAQVKPAQGDRVRHADLDAFLTYNQGYRPAGAARADEVVRVIGMRRRIAENIDRKSTRLNSSH